MDELNLDAIITHDRLLLKDNIRLEGNYAGLFEALAKAQKNYRALNENKSVSVNSKNGRSYSYDYADLAATIDAVRPALTREGVAVIQTVSKGRVETILGHKDGGHLICITEFANSDLSPQNQGSLFTFYKRYSLAAAVGIASGGEDIDASETAEGSAKIINLRRTHPLPNDTKRWSQFITSLNDQLALLSETKDVQGIDAHLISVQRQLAELQTFDLDLYQQAISLINQHKKEAQS